MSLSIASLNSGSNGNCYYVGNEEEAVLVDAGISCRETERRMKRLELDMRKVKAIFITHEHTDHINGIRVLVKKHKLPVYITPSTKNNGRIFLPPHLTFAFKAYDTVKIGGLEITAIPKLHDAIDPHSFLVSDHHTTVGVFTDIGVACEHVVHSFQQCHAAFLEANYDTEMLENGSYPMGLKNRIRGGKGHLSNAQALRLFLEHRPAHMSHLLLAHLSRDNNHPEIVRNLFKAAAGDTSIIVASRYEETPVFSIQGSAEIIRKPIERPLIKAHPVVISKSRKPVRVKNQFQLSLF